MPEPPLSQPIAENWSYLYAEHCRIEQDDRAVVLVDSKGRVAVPAAALAVLMLGPGTSITHRAVGALAENGTTLLWTGEQGVRFYAGTSRQGSPNSRLLHQVGAFSDPASREKVVRRMYARRQGGESGNEPMAEIQGREGARIRDSYREWAAKTGVPWNGIAEPGTPWKWLSPAQQALEIAEECLSGLAQAAVWSQGYSPGIGFIHQRTAMAFVQDVMDLYRTEVIIPAAFSGLLDLDEKRPLNRVVRQACRDRFAEMKLLRTIVRDLDQVLGFGGEVSDEVLEKEPEGVDE